MTSAILEVAAERLRQQDVEGWTPEHDDTHCAGEMVMAAVCYSMHAAIATKWLGTGACGLFDQAAPGVYPPPPNWPSSWDPSWWKPKDPRRDLVRAAALIIAEIERIDRAAEAFRDE